MDRSAVVIPKGMEPFYEQWHFAPAIRDGDRLWCSGMIGIGADGKCASDPTAQFTRAFELVQGVLETSGVGFGDVVDMTTFHVGLQQHIGAFTKVKDQFLRAPYPAWTAIGITELAVPGGLVEIKVVARLPR